MMRYLARTTLVPLLAVAFIALLAPAANAEVIREQLSNAKPTNLVNISPIRIEADVEPGTRLIRQVTIYNDSAKPVHVTTRPIDMGPARDETLLAATVEGSSEFGAKDWITSELADTVLQPFEKVKFDVIIDPPADAPVGSSYGGLEFRIDTANADGTVDEPSETDAKSGLAFKITSVLQILLTVPGNTVRDLKLIEANTKDAFHLGGQSFVTYGVRYRNDGTVNDHVKGKIVVKSLFGNTVKTIKLRDLTMIRGSTRSDRAVWSDTPSFGLFSAKAMIKGDDGKTITKDLGRVYILPPWWLLVLILLAIVAPIVYFWWKRRREWMQYLEDDDWEDDEDENLAY